MVSDAIESGNTQAINYFVAQKYVDALSDFARSPNQKIVFMPLEVSGLIGSIGGISELWRDLGGPGGGNGASPQSSSSVPPVRPGQV